MTILEALLLAFVVAAAVAFVTAVIVGSRGLALLNALRQGLAAQDTRASAALSLVSERLTAAEETARDAMRRLAEVAGRDSEVDFLRKQLVARDEAIKQLEAKLLALVESRIAVALEDRRLESEGRKHTEPERFARGGRWMPVSRMREREATPEPGTPVGVGNVPRSS